MLNAFEKEKTSLLPFCSLIQFIVVYLNKKKLLLLLSFSPHSHSKGLCIPIDVKEWMRYILRKNHVSCFWPFLLLINFFISLSRFQCTLIWKPDLMKRKIFEIWRAVSKCVRLLKRCVSMVKSSGVTRCLF